MMHLKTIISDTVNFIKLVPERKTAASDYCKSKFLSCLEHVFGGLHITKSYKSKETNNYPCQNNSAKPESIDNISPEEIKNLCAHAIAMVENGTDLKGMWREEPDKNNLNVKLSSRNFSDFSPVEIAYTIKQWVGEIMYGKQITEKEVDEINQCKIFDGTIEKIIISRFPSNDKASETNKYKLLEMLNVMFTFAEKCKRDQTKSTDPVNLTLLTRGGVIMQLFTAEALVNALSKKSTEVRGALVDNSQPAIFFKKYSKAFLKILSYYCGQKTSESQSNSLKEEVLNDANEIRISSSDLKIQESSTRGLQYARSDQLAGFNCNPEGKTSERESIYLHEEKFTDNNEIRNCFSDERVQGSSTRNLQDARPGKIAGFITYFAGYSVLTNVCLFY